MKTAISIPDDIFARADRLARRLGKSRNAPYAEAVSRYLAEQSARSVTQRLNAVHDDGGDRGARLDAGLARAQRKAIAREQW